MRHIDIYTLEISNLSVMRGDLLLIDGLSFSLSSGDMLWVNGSNGIGKTSLLKCIAGLLRPQNGAVMWGGTDLQHSGETPIAYLGHNDAHKPNLTVLENLEFWQSIFGTQQSIELALKRVGLWHKKNLRANGLSAGQSRRLSLARLIIRAAPLWVMDEPSAAMDTKGRTVIRDLISEHISSGGIAILASHALPDKVGKNTRVLTLESSEDASA